MRGIAARVAHVPVRAWSDRLVFAAIHGATDLAPESPAWASCPGVRRRSAAMPR
jgi:hypothetical protein